MEIETIKFRLHIIELINNLPVTNIAIENVKFLIDKSIVKTFGMFTAGKISYRLNKTNNDNMYEIQCYKKDINAVITSLMLVCDLEYKIRISLLSYNTI